MSDERVLTVQLTTMAIENGMLDDGLDAILAAVRHRKDRLAARAAASLNPGDRFYIKDCSPKKWNDETVTFHHREGVWLFCSADENMQRRLRCAATIQLRESHVGYIMRKEG